MMKCVPEDSFTSYPSQAKKRPEKLAVLSYARRDDRTLEMADTSPDDDEIVTNSVHKTAEIQN